MKVLVIGGTGFIGQNVVRRLIAQGIAVAVFHRGKTNAAFPDTIEHIYGDRNHLKEYSSRFKKFDPEVVVDIIPYTKQQAKAVVAVFTGLARRVVGISSGDVYRNYGGLNGIGNSPPDSVPLSEESPLRESLFPYRKHATDKSDWLYDYEKILVERALMREPLLPCTILRLPKVYGPRDSRHSLFGYLKRMDDRRPALILEEGQQDWLWTRGFVDNVSAAIVLAATDERTTGQIYNIGDENTLTEAEWIAHIAEAANWQGKIVVLPKSDVPGHLRTEHDWRYPMSMDTSKFRHERGYREPVALDEALMHTVRWTRANPPAKVAEANFDYHAEDTAIKEHRGVTIEVNPDHV